MKIYTKTGDTGETGLLGGDRIGKTSLRIKAIGKVDSLNAALGVATVVAAPTLKSQLKEVQSRLFDLGSELACPPGGKFDIQSVTQTDISAMETSMDEMTEQLAPLKQFILPGGSSTAAQLHVCRAAAREAEIAILDLNASESVRSELIMYVNRLSDWLFTAARFANHLEGTEDQVWNPRNT
ncbi:MAG TPA: cob(I)yrinic acid a,c-diamide adenosyltransferase [Fimbriimonas sp.]|nr:cob(I)yrinic acid a,c-diamide adenosyltransferase [Fimbriimonas sp.]